MFKKLLLSLIYILIGHATQAQTQYEVISLLGTIINKTQKDTLKESSVYKSTDKLGFSDEEDFMGVVDDNGNTFMVMVDPEEDTVLYESIPKAVSRRRGKITSSLALIDHFAENYQYLVMGNETQIELGPSAFPMNTDSFFYIRYTYQGEEIINKKLSFNGIFLTISKNELFNVKYKKSEILGSEALGDTVLVLNPQLASAFELRYYAPNNNPPHITFYDPNQPDEKQKRSFIPFNPVFLEHSSLAREVTVLYQSLIKIKPEEKPIDILRLISQYIEEEYKGQVYLLNLESWMKKQRIIE